MPRVGKQREEVSGLNFVVIRSQGIHLQRVLHCESRHEGCRPMLFVLRDREIHPDASFDHNDVAADLADDFPAGLLKSFDSFLAGDLLSLPIKL